MNTIRVQPDGNPDHDLLVRIDERVTKLDKSMSNHLQHHWALTLAVAGSAFAAATALVVQLVMSH